MKKIAMFVAGAALALAVAKPVHADPLGNMPCSFNEYNSKGNALTISGTCDFFEQEGVLEFQAIHMHNASSSCVLNLFNDGAIADTVGPNGFATGLAMYMDIDLVSGTCPVAGVNDYVTLGGNMLFSPTPYLTGFVQNYGGGIDADNFNLGSN